MVEPYYSDKLRTIYHGDCRGVLSQLGERFTAVVTDPPYELGFMGKSWDSQGVSFSPVTWSIIRAACLPGAFLLSFAGTRTMHRIACAIEDGGWELRDTIGWIYATGFPKSLDISKAIDKAKGAERRVIGSKVGMPGYSLKHQGAGGVLAGRADGSLDNSEGECAVTAPATDEAKRWSGYGTALKPAWEPITVAMNPVEKSFAENALRHGVAGVNIDGGRVLAGEDYKDGGPRFSRGAMATMGNHQTRPWVEERIKSGEAVKDIKASPLGRFPANLIHDGSEEVMELFPDSKTSRVEKPCPAPEIRGHKWGTMQQGRPARGYDGNGSAARFFYCAKASRAERDAGLEGGQDRLLARSGGAQGAEGRGEGEYLQEHIGLNRISVVKNNHPTVKPLALMEYLCKLVKYPEERNLLLDPFCGSGTTLLAAGRLGIQTVGVDADEHSCEIAAERCAADVVARIKRGEY